MLNKSEREKIRARAESATETVNDICSGKARWIMHIPAQRGDSDVVIGAALADISRLLAEINALERAANTGEVLAHNGLAEEFGMMGCDVLDQVCDALLGARAEIARLKSPDTPSEDAKNKATALIAEFRAAYDRTMMGLIEFRHEFCPDSDSDGYEAINHAQVMVYRAFSDLVIKDIQAEKAEAQIARLKSPNTPEPPPLPSDGPAVWDLVIADIRERDAVGTEKYGTRLTVGDGRGPADAYQELLDLIVYTRKWIAERDGLVSEISRLRALLPPKHAADCGSRALVSDGCVAVAGKCDCGVTQ